MLLKIHGFDFTPNYAGFDAWKKLSFILVSCAPSYDNEVKMKVGD